MGRHRKISISEIKSLAKKGLAQREIAQQVGCCRQYISQVVQAYNVKIKKDLRLIKKPRIRECVMCGYEFKPVKYETTCSYDCHKARYEPKYTNIVRKFTASDVRKIRRWYNNGKLVRDIADFYGCGLAAVYNVIRGKTYSYVK